ncbi:MAG: dethiobiotin synthase [Spirochaetes bacterium]|nr:dethiobiotin synthase [Spirochaetota bacterium]
MKSIFICGIDTDIGKTYCTGLIARYLIKQNQKAITAKLVQTGCSGIAEDILVHRQLMDLPALPEDQQSITCPFVFPFPASPHLAADMVNQIINLNVIDQNINKLAQTYQYVLIEGAGGLMVPLSKDTTTLDYISKRKFPTILVTSPRLGSINHTCLTIEVLHSHQIIICGLIYNLFQTTDPQITISTRDYFINRYPDIPLMDVPHIDIKKIPDIDFSPIFSKI